MTILTIVWAFILAHWLDILVAVAFVGFLVYLWKRGKKDVVKRILYGLVVRAEKELGSRTGPEKKALVYSWLPWIIKLVWSQDDIEHFIEEGVDQLKRRLRTKRVNLLSYDDEAQLKALEELTTPACKGAEVSE
jgi:hypothetical protein